MSKLYKTTLLITMAVVTWKVWKIEKNSRRPMIKIKNFDKLKTNRCFGSSQNIL